MTFSVPPFCYNGGMNTWDTDQIWGVYVVEVSLTSLEARVVHRRAELEFARFDGPMAVVDAQYYARQRDRMDRLAMESA